MSEAVWLPVDSATGESMLLGGGSRIVYTNMYETTGSAVASVILYDGNPSDGKIVVPYTLLANESARDQWPTHGVPVEGDLWVTYPTGAAAGSVYVVSETLWDVWQREQLSDWEKATLNAAGIP